MQTALHLCKSVLVNFMGVVAFVSIPTTMLSTSSVAFGASGGRVEQLGGVVRSLPASSANFRSRKSVVFNAGHKVRENQHFKKETSPTHTFILLFCILGVVTALRRSQLSPRIENVREKVGGNGKMCWWKCCDAPFGENRVGSLTGRGEIVLHDKTNITSKTK